MVWACGGWLSWTRCGGWFSWTSDTLLWLRSHQIDCPASCAKAKSYAVKIAPTQNKYIICPKQLLPKQWKVGTSRRIFWDILGCVLAGFFRMQNRIVEKVKLRLEQWAPSCSDRIVDPAERWPSGSVHSGIVEEWHSGIVEEWHSGIVEEWNSGRVAE